MQTRDEVFISGYANTENVFYCLSSKLSRNKVWEFFSTFNQFLSNEFMKVELSQTVKRYITFLRVNIHQK